MKKLLSFSFYDFGNSVFPMIIITTLTSSYFVNHVIDNQQQGTALWQLIIGVSGILIAFMMPFIGKLSDTTNNGRVIYLRFFSIILYLSALCFSAMFFFHLLIRLEREFLQNFYLSKDLCHIFLQVVLQS